MYKISQWLHRLFRSRLASGMAVMTAGNSLRLLINMLAFFIVAPTMGASEFGAFAAVLSTVMIIGTFSGWGSERLVVRRASRAPEEFPEALATCLVFLAITAPCLIGLALIVVPLVVSKSISFEMICLIAVADIFFTSVNSISAACYQSLGRAFGTASLNVSYSVVRVLAALVWIFLLDEHDALTWSWCYFLASLLVATVSITRVTRELGRPNWSRIHWEDWKNGFHFALQFASASAFREIDKPVVAALSSLATVGVYAAASRMATAAIIPVQALMYAAIGRFFQLGAAGPRKGLKFALRLLPINVGIGIVTGICIAVVAPFAAALLGKAFEGTTHVLFVLALFPVFYSLYSLAGNFIIGTDNAWVRTAVQILIPPLDVALCLLLVPRYGAIGAASAAVISHAIAAAGAWGAVWMIVRRAPVEEPAAAP